MDNITGGPDGQANATANTAATALEQVFAHATNVTIAALPDARPNSAAASATRDLSAITQIAALVPANAAEVMVAVQFVVTGAQGLECQRLAQDGAAGVATPMLRMAATMFRVSHAAANTLLRLQHARRVREATPELAGTAAMLEHGSLQLMAKALAKREAARTVAEQAAAERAAADAATRALPPPPAPEPEPIGEDDIAAAEAYARSNPSNLNRARIMRRKGGMPNWGMFTPPEPNVVRAIAFGHSAFLDGLLPPAR